MGNHRRRRSKGEKSTAQYLYEQMGGEGECYVATNVHHRRSKHTGGSNSERNLSRVPVKAHNEYNRLFRDGHMHPTEMAKVLTDKWIDPDWQMIAIRKGSKIPDDGQLHLFHEEVSDQVVYHSPPKHDCTQCPNHQLREMLNPMLRTMAQEALARAF